VGLLIYSDPADDGFVRGETWPQASGGPTLLAARECEVQLVLARRPADSRRAGALRCRAARSGDGADAPHIPVAVLSWGEARKILEQFNGAVVPSGFQGGLPFTYRVGPDNVRVRLRVQRTTDCGPFTTSSRACPALAWRTRRVVGHALRCVTFGGVDPGTGTAALLELAERWVRCAAAAGNRSARSLLRSGTRRNSLDRIHRVRRGAASQLQAGTICYVNTACTRMDGSTPEACRRCGICWLT